MSFSKLYYSTSNSLDIRMLGNVVFFECSAHDVIASKSEQLI